jgi:hypothetical protein
MIAKKKIVEKGSYEKGKVEKYASKSAMAKHEKKESKAFEKKESIKPKGPAPKQMRSGSPIRQSRTPEEEKLHQERLSKMTPADHADIKARSIRPPAKNTNKAEAMARGKGPVLKQFVDPNAKKIEQNRLSKMTEKQRIEERKNPRNTKTGTPIPPMPPKTLRGRKEAPAPGPMQLRSPAKTAPTKMKKC